MKGERDVGWFGSAFKVLTAHGEVAREGARMKDEHNVRWLGPAFAVLSARSSQRALKKAQVRKERTQKRQTKQRKP